MLSFADCSKLALLWFFIPNVHQFLRIVYAKWSPSNVFAFDTLYWTVAFEVSFCNLCSVWRRSILLEINPVKDPWIDRIQSLEVWYNLFLK